jgi:hypothetical protein
MVLKPTDEKEHKLKQSKQIEDALKAVGPTPPAGPALTLAVELSPFHLLTAGLHDSHFAQVMLRLR